MSLEHDVEWFERGNPREDYGVRRHELQVQWIPVRDIVTSGNPRHDMGDLASLANSVKRLGVCQPIHLQGEAPPYTMVAGERRWRAAKLAGLSTIPAFVLPINAQNRVVVNLVENMQRKNLNPMEEAEGFRQMVAIVSQTTIARMIGKTQSYVSNSIRLFKLPDAVQEQIRSGELSRSHGLAILRQDPSAQEEVADEIMRVKMPAKRAEQLGRPVVGYDPAATSDTTEILALLMTVHRTADKLYLAVLEGDQEAAQKLLARLHDKLNWARGLIDPRKAEEYGSAHVRDEVPA